MISTKLEAFIAGHLGPDRSLSSRSLRAAGIGRTGNLKHLLFEEAVSVDSGTTGPKDRVFFGGHSYINSGGYLHGTVFIGRYCSIGRRVSIGAGAHAMTGLTTSSWLMSRPEDKNRTEEYLAWAGASPPKEYGPTIIENDVWIGDGAIIFPGVRISTGAVIGANSVVRRDVPPYAIVAGISSTPLRYRFKPEIRSRLLETRWWDFPHKTLSGLPTGDVRRFLAEIESLSKEGNPPGRPTYSLLPWHKETWPVRTFRALRKR